MQRRQKSFTQHQADQGVGGYGHTNTGLTPGKIYKGQVTECLHGDQLYHVTIDNGSVVHNCMWAAGMFSSLLGFKTSYFPAAGTRVIVLYGQPSFVIGTLPGDPADATGGNERIMTSTGDGRGLFNGENPKNLGRAHTPPADLLEGEFEIGNEIGVAIQFLTNLIAIKGGERAKVEAHLTNDMVRIVSDVFKSFNAFGDHQIYNDGGLNVRWDGTSREHEAMGTATKYDKKAEVDGRKVDEFSDLHETGRWRFSQFVGFLGDFIHLFVSDPSTSLSNIGASANKRSGKARAWIGSDGTILAQSVTEIALERVCRIVVPAEKKAWDDAEGFTKTAWQNMINSSKEFTKVWNFGTGNRDIYQASYQLREYARWMSNYHSYARFHQYESDEEKKEWEVGGESDVGASWLPADEEVQEANRHLTSPYFDTYACIRIMRDGAIVLWDGYGSGVSMTRGLIQLSATRHLDLSAAGDVRITAGNDVYIKARRNVEVIAVVGSFVAKARTAWKALCEWGTIWLKSDAKDPNKVDVELPTPVDANNDPEPEIHSSAIIIDASRGAITVNSDRRLTLQATGIPDDSEDKTDTTSSVVIQSQQQDVRIHGYRLGMLKSLTEYASIEGASGVLTLGPKLLSNASLFDIRNLLTFKNGVLNTFQVKAYDIRASGNLAGPLPVAWVDTDQKKPGYHRHGNHVGIATSGDAPTFASGDDHDVYDDYKDEVLFSYKSGFTSPDNINGPTWGLSANYNWTYRDSYTGASLETEKLIQPLAQQRIEFDTDLSAYYGDWEFSTTDQLNTDEAPRTRRDFPWPGTAARHLTHTSDKDPLHQPTTDAHSDFDPSIKTPLASTPITIKYLKK